MIVYEAIPPIGSQRGTEFATETAAKQHGEALGEGASIITWNVSNNLPYCKPDKVYRSCSLQHFRNGEWVHQNIHGGW